MKLSSLVVVFALALIGTSANAQSDRPNILVIVADDLAYADLGIHGSIIRTPHIDALAGEGIQRGHMRLHRRRFESHHSGGDASGEARGGNGRAREGGAE